MSAMKKNEFDPIMCVEDDSLFIDEVGIWAQEKYNLIGQYCHVFTKSMKNKWDNLVYIDLFSGSGYAKIRESKKTIKSSALISLSIPCPFSKYILCEKDDLKFYTLQERIRSNYNHFDVSLVKGDCNLVINDIISLVPEPNKGNTVLCFCFVDPFSLDLNFNTIKELSKYRVDFLILLAFWMDANRNFKVYLKENNTKIENFLGNFDWRKKFNDNSAFSNNSDFLKFLADEYQNNMKNLGYIKNNEFHQIRSTDKNLPLYHLAFFSRSDLGNKFWRIVQKYSNGQERFDF